MSGHSIPPLVQPGTLGFGGSAIGGHDYGPVDDATCVAAVNKAVDCGINFFDTADCYGLGRSEEILSRALGSRRHEVTIATKVGVRWDTSGRTARDLSARYIEQAIDDSLRRLRLDSIPLYQVHWPDPATTIEETFSSLARLQQQGKVRAIGCCNVDTAYLSKARPLCRIDTLQVPFSLIQREWERVMLDCRAWGMQTIVYNALGQGLLSGKFDHTTRFHGTDLRRRSALFQGERFARALRVAEAVSATAATVGATTTQAALRWAIDHPAVDVALVGIKSPGHAEENAGAMRVQLTPQAWSSLAAID